MQKRFICFLLSFFFVLNAPSISQTGMERLPVKGKLIYKNSLDDHQAVKDWKMEGPGHLNFKNGWMEMYSPDKKGHHVFWCPRDFPASFIAEWEMQNIDTSNGFVIVFFNAKGTGGEDIFDPALPARDGTFEYYTSGQINCYHISYYSNSPDTPRDKSHLRKDPQFALLQRGEEGIAKKSTAIHHIRLMKAKAYITMYVDNRKIIDYTDDAKAFGPVYGEGKIGFRQMKWTDFRYRNFKV
jgi:hypothetical protein